MLLPSHHRPRRLAGVRQWSDFVCLFSLKLLGAQKNRITAVNTSRASMLYRAKIGPRFMLVYF